MQRLEVLMGVAAGWVDHRFPAMGSHAHLVLLGDTADAEWAEREVRRLELHWSRFAPTSDVSRANRAAGRNEVAVAPETILLVEEAVDWWHRTDGWFDPTVLHALEALGYDATFTEVRDRPAGLPVVRSAPPGRPELRIAAVGRTPEPAPAPGCAGIETDRAAGTLRLPHGVGLDLGGIGKGKAADRVAAGLRARGVTAACVSLGGDVRAYGAGNGPDGRGWAIPVEDPGDESRVLFTHTVDDGAIVTCTDRFRRWVYGGRVQHHLVDPTTGLPADTGLTAVVVADTTCARAEVLAKAAFVGGPGRGGALLARFGVDAWFVDQSGT
ncbi:MAG: FAD:protein FMN transferase, partial [Acidimicrobiia bacterium]